jgi:hypothetical protein
MKLILTVCLGYLISSPSAFAGPDATETFEDSVVIRSQVANGNTGICSGALIAPDLVVTAAHCLDGNTRHRVNRVSQSQGWVPSSAIYIHPKYNPSQSFSAFDIGFIRLAYPVRGAALVVKPVCQQDHWGEAVTRVGFGGREGYNRKMIFSMPEANFLRSTQTLVLEDPYSASGDSGGPIYAVENGEYCLLGVHSTVTLDRVPELSYNPSVRGALTTLNAMMRE